MHQSYYFYEELYQLPSGRTPAVLASHAAAHLLLGHADEAKADIDEAVQQGGEGDGNVLAVGAALGMEGYAQYVISLPWFKTHNTQILMVQQTINSSPKPLLRKRPRG